MTENENRSEGIEKVAGLIKGIEIAMLTTIDENGTPHSRPMATQQVEFDGDLWFFSSDHSLKASEIEKNPNVNVAYAAPNHQDYVSVSGRAEVLYDRAKMEEFWQAQYKAWFPQELETPGICLLKVETTRAEYWDAPSRPVAYAIGLAKALTGKPEKIGDHDTVTLAR